MSRDANIIDGFGGISNAGSNGTFVTVDGNEGKFKKGDLTTNSLSGYIDGITTVHVPEKPEKRIREHTQIVVHLSMPDGKGGFEKLQIQFQDNHGVAFPALVNGLYGLVKEYGATLTDKLVHFFVKVPEGKQYLTCSVMHGSDMSNLVYAGYFAWKDGYYEGWKKPTTDAAREKVRKAWMTCLTKHVIPALPEVTVTENEFSPEEVAAAAEGRPSEPVHNTVAQDAMDDDMDDLPF